MCTPYTGPLYKDFRLHLLLLGKTSLTAELRGLVQEAHKKLCINLEVHLANDLEVLVRYGCDLSFDFIFVCLDTRERFNENTIQFIESQLALVDKHYRFASKIALVLAWNSAGKNGLRCFQQIADFAARLGLPIIQGDTKNPQTSDVLAEQILEVAMSAGGAWSSFGVPIAKI